MPVTAQAPQLGQHQEAQIAADRRRVDLHAEIDAAEPAFALAEARRIGRASNAGSSWHNSSMPGLRKSCTEIRLVLDAQFLARDAAHARRRDLGLRHAHHVLVRHAHGKMARDFLQQLARAPPAASASTQGAQPVEIEPRIGDALIGDRAGGCLPPRSAAPAPARYRRLRVRAARASPARVFLLVARSSPAASSPAPPRARRGSRADCRRPPCRRRGSRLRTARRERQPAASRRWRRASRR